METITGALFQIHTVIEILIQDSLLLFQNACPLGTTEALQSPNITLHILEYKSFAI